MRAVVVALAVALGGCAGALDPSEWIPVPEPPLEVDLTETSLQVTSRVALGSIILAVHVDGGPGATCEGSLHSSWAQRDGILAAVVDSTGTSDLVAVSAVGARAGEDQVAVLAAAGPAVLAVDDAPFEGERWLWFYAADVQQGEPILPSIPTIIAPSLLIDLRCHGAMITDVLAGTVAQAVHWTTEGEAAAALWSSGAWVAAEGVSLAIELPAGALLLAPAWRGSDSFLYMIQTPGQEAEAGVLGGPVARFGGPGTYAVRLAGAQDIPAGVILASEPVPDLEAWLWQRHADAWAAATQHPK